MYVFFLTKAEESLKCSCNVKSLQGNLMNGGNERKAIVVVVMQPAMLGSN